MLDGVSLDQLRIFVAAADEGSFSAAARRGGAGPADVRDLPGCRASGTSRAMYDQAPEELPGKGHGGKAY